MFNFQTTLGQAEFENPIFTASGCAGSGKELSQFLMKYEYRLTDEILIPIGGRKQPRNKTRRKNKTKRQINRKKPRPASSALRVKTP